MSGNGGTISVVAVPEATELSVELFASATPDATAALTYGDGHCDVALYATLPPALQSSDRDLGPQISATNGTLVLAADAAREGDHVVYQTESLDLAFGTTFEITSATGTLATVRVPAQIAQQEDTVVHAAGTPATLHFTGGAAAQYVQIHLASDLGTADCYPVPGATAFDVSATLLDTIIGVDRSFTVDVYAKNRAVVPIDGRLVEVLGISQLAI